MVMRTRRQSPEQQEIITRRLATLSAELTPAESTPSRWGPIDSELALAFQPWDPPAAPSYDGEERRDPIDFALPPVPGRHAARRRSGVISQLVPEGVRQRLALGPAQVSVIALLVAIGLIATAWWAIASRPEPTADRAALMTSEASPEPLIEAKPTSSPDSTDLIVDVAGRVRRPGIAVLAPGSRVVDALEAAGGVRRGVDLSTLNLARPLVDGEQILVGVPQPAGVGAAAAAPPSSGASAPQSLVNLNTAGQVELETLPGVGPVTAQAIITWRTEHNGFGAVEELLDVRGIGEATLAELAPHVTV